MTSTYEDVYFDEDAIYMERNSRDFKRRIKVIDANAEAVCDFLRSRSVAGGAPLPVVKEVFYPSTSPGAIMNIVGSRKTIQLATGGADLVDSSH